MQRIHFSFHTNKTQAHAATRTINRAESIAKSLAGASSTRTAYASRYPIIIPPISVTTKQCRARRVTSLPAALARLQASADALL